MIQLRNISYQYPNQINKILDHFDLEIQKGDVVIASGGNGTGKTTLLRIIAGIIPKFTGGLFEGTRKLDSENYDSIHADRFGMLFHGIEQQFIQSRVNQEFLYILEGQGLSATDAQSKLEQIQKEFNIEHLIGREIHTLSSGELQLIKLALAFVLMPDIVLMDEPFSHLDPKMTDRVLDTLIFMRDRYNLTYVIADHQKKIWEKFGSKVRYIDFSTVLENELLTSAPNLISPSLGQLLSIKNVDFSYLNQKIFSNLNCEIGKGECVAVIGDNGSGKTTLLHLLMERLKPIQGKIVKERNVKMRMLSNPVQMNFFSQKIKDELALEQSNLDNTPIFSLEHWMERYVFDLSQGEQRKVAIELLCRKKVDLLLLDEPFLHLDIHSRNKTLQAIQNLNKAGVSTVITAHDDSVLKNISNQIWRVGK